MKTKSYLIGLLILSAGLITFSMRQLPAQGGSHHQTRSFIVIQSAESFIRGPNQEYIPTGLKVLWVESDQNAPEIKKDDRLADTIAKCLDLGYTYEQMLGGRHLLKR